MKHLLNDLSEQEKNSIREQHTGGMKVMTENFSRLLNAKSGDVKTLVAEQNYGPKLTTGPTQSGIDKSMALGATAGALAGTAILPGIGTAVGAVVGGLAGLAKSILSGSGTSDQQVKKALSFCSTQNIPSSPEVDKMTDAIYDAIQGVGTNNQVLIKTFTSVRDLNQLCALVKRYKENYNRDLYDDLDGDIDNESEWAQIFRPIRDAAAKVGTLPTAPPVSPVGGIQPINGKTV